MVTHRRVLSLTADFHVGSDFAVFPEGFRAQGGKRIWLTKGQKVLLKHYYSYVKSCDELNVDTVVLPGDIIEGLNFAEAGAGLCVDGLDNQENAAVLLLKPLVKNRKVYIISGSGYHKSTKNHNPEEDIAQKLAPHTKETHFLGPVANIYFPPSKRLFNIQHGQSAGSLYKETSMGREAVFFKWAEALGKLPKFDIIVKAHGHEFAYLHKNGQHLLQLPCWKTFHPWKGSLLHYAKYQSDIGGCIVFLDVADRILVWHMLYPAPRIADPVQHG